MYVLYVNFDLAKGIWYPIVLTILLILIILISPKKLSKQEFYVTFGVIGYVVWMVDITLAAPFDIFDIGTKRNGLPELLLFGLIPSCIAIIFLNFYQSTSKKKALIILFIISSFILEWLAEITGIMTSKIWHAYYSIPIFTVVFYFALPWHLKFIRTGDYSNK
ncbi:hypothetical protein CJ195_10180 [Bacillus sp. UMB0899]|uniref:hypothetical protein n=1 Tax=Metabacillus schmidteae TaxID=2730405 RepID=UPI000C80DE82|nr:hypothetical protein [Metabacillus schmidteae]PMC37955.1 hypothetical protein CJ195_10180 [Bacillus sp. UMB0899]